MKKSAVLLVLFLSFNTSGHLIKDHASGVFPPLPKKSPCIELSMEETGITCKVGEPSWDTRLFLPFPHVFVKEEEINSIQAFPSSAISESVDFLKIPTGKGDSFLELRQVCLTLSLQPVTPTYLMPYLSDIWPFWGGNRVPYMARWEVSYWMFADDHWEEYHHSGKISPADIPNLQVHLAADVDYNGVPSAFWNYQVELDK